MAGESWMVGKSRCWEGFGKDLYGGQELGVRQDSRYEWDSR